jgi:hypothetical protein
MRAIALRVVALVIVALACAGVRGQLLADPSTDFANLPVGPGVRGWFVPIAGSKAEVISGQPSAGERCVRLWKSGASDERFGNLMRMVSASPYRGRHVVLSAMVRVERGEAEAGPAQMWLRVVRPSGRSGAIDNMSDRPILPGEGTRAVIEADVAEDARAIELGFMSYGGVTVFIDSLSFAVTGDGAPSQEPSPPKALSSRELESLIAAARLLACVMFFDASDQAAGVTTWDHVATAAMEAAEGAADPRDLARRLGEFFAPISPSLQVWAGAPEDAPATPAVPEGATRFSFWKRFGAGKIGASPSNICSSEVRRAALDEPTNGSDSDRVAVKPLGGGVCCRWTIKALHDDTGRLPRGATREQWTRPPGARSRRHPGTPPKSRTAPR